MKKLLTFVLIVCFAGVSLGAQEYSANIPWTRGGTHQTSNTTWTPVASTCVLNVLVMNVSAIGTSWVITVKTKESTPRTLWTGTAALGTVPIFQGAVGIEMTNGIDVTFSGTAGTADFFIVYR